MSLPLPVGVLMIALAIFAVAVNGSIGLALEVEEEGGSGAMITDFDCSLVERCWQLIGVAMRYWVLGAGGGRLLRISSVYYE
mmetsp:Transcript_5410/g.10459  ORF Transcript_5410/g.10459 Transcript_5410/m.10459 type:complete len:82 (+) Transcript_5410:2880-3125(+)